MNNLNLMPHEAERNPIVFVRDGEVFANSREVATYFDKRHDDVLKAIRKLIAAEPDLGLRNFAETPYVDGQNGQTYKSFDMDQDGFSLLAMGFTGAKALKWKLKYIEAFKTMRSHLSQPRPIDYSDPQLLLGVVGHLQSKVGEQAALLAEQSDRLKKLDRIEGAYGSLCLTDAAKTLKKRPQELIRFMQGRGWIYKRVGNASWCGRQEKIVAGYLEHREHVYRDSEGVERVATRALVTGKGLVKLAELLEQPLH